MVIFCFYVYPMGDFITIKYETFDDVPEDWDARDPVKLTTEESLSTKGWILGGLLLGPGAGLVAAGACQIGAKIPRELKYGQRTRLDSAPGHLIDTIILENSSGAKRTFRITANDTNRTYSIWQMWNPGGKSRRAQLQLLEEEEKESKAVLHKFLERNISIQKIFQETKSGLNETKQRFQVRHVAFEPQREEEVPPAQIEVVAEARIDEIMRHVEDVVGKFGILQAEVARAVDTRQRDGIYRAGIQ